jgi:hypothetical protein
MYIDIEDRAEVVDKDTYLKATVRIESELESDRLEVPTEIRGRGNSTWNMPKKPYRLRLAAASPVLGMPAERDWALLANFADKTLARNKLGMTLGERMGMVWTPRSRFVELHVNGDNRGVYQVYEHVKTGPDRADVEPLDEEVDIDPQTISGGWLLEVDKRYDEDVCWDTSLSLPICVKSPGLDADDAATPGHPSQVQAEYIRNYVDSAEQALDKPDEEWRQFFDVPALIDWYLVNEIMRNYDAKMGTSVYLHKSRSGPLVFGPLWDFDIGAGNIDFDGVETPTGWWIRDSVWHTKLFSRPNFRQEVFTRWCELERANITTGLGEMVDTIAASIGAGPVERNFQRWPYMGTYVWPNFFVGPTYESEVDYLKSWLKQRVDWMGGEYQREFGACPRG